MPYYHYIHIYMNHPWWKMATNYQRKQYLNDRKWFLENKSVILGVDAWLNRIGCKCNIINIKGDNNG